VAAGVADREYIWLPLDLAGGGDQAWALPLALVTDAGTSGPRIHYLHTDQLGTPVAMTSGGLGQLEWSAVLRPFGEVESITGTESLALRLPGQVFDPETGFHQNWHRDYDPRLGRYLQSDPIGLEGGLNNYAYVGGDPIMRADPSGQIWDALLDLAFIGYDLFRLAAEGPCEVHENLLVLSADAVGFLIPGVVGLGITVRAGTTAADAVRAAEHLTARAARREAMRRAGIPTSQQPIAQSSRRASNGEPVGRQYDYETPTPGGGIQRQSVQHSLTDTDHGPPL
jgi:RHS repeat-associated protein